MALYSKLNSTGKGNQRFVRQMIAVLLSAVTIWAVFWVFAERGGYVASVCALAFVASHIIAVGWLLQDDLFSPLSGVWLALFLGTSLRSVYLALSESDRVSDMMWHLTFEDLATGAGIATLSAVFITLGYLISARLALPIRGRVVTGLRYNRLFGFSVVVLVVALIAAVDFFRQTGFDLSLGISAKRRFETDGDSVQGFAALGYHRWFACILPCVFFYFWYWEFVRSRNRLAGALAFTFFMTAASFAFLASSRSVICFLLLNSLYILHSFGYLRLYHVSLVVATVCVVLTVMLGLRQLSTGVSTDTNVANKLKPAAAMDAVLGNENFSDLGRLSLIHRSVPSVFRYRYGMSYLSFILAPIPRTQWRDKPVLSQGLEISEVIYGARRSAKGIEGGGRPPGFIGEVIINFGLLGVPFCSALYGFFLRVFHNFHLSNSRSNVLLSVFVLVPISFGLMGGEFSMAMIEILQALVPGILLFWLVARTAPRGEIA